MSDRPVMFVVYTRSGLRRHAALDGGTSTLCGREHMGFRSSTSGSPVPRFTRGVARFDGVCKICIQQSGVLDDHG